MQLDNGITLILIIIAAVAAAGVVWAIMRRRLPPEAIADIAKAAAQVRSMLAGVVSEQDVQALAGYLYDNFASGSNYLSRQQFIDLVTRAVLQAQVSTPAIRASAQADGMIAG